MLNNVPVVGQTLGASRDLINANFVTINTAFSVNHVPYNDGSGNQGMHQFVQMPAGTPVIATAAGQIGLYAKNGSVSGVPELYFQRQSLAANSGYAITESSIPSFVNGWTRLPSGALMIWGRTSMVAGTKTVIYNNAGTGGQANFPTFTAFSTPQLTRYNAGVADNNIVYLSSYSANQFTAQSATANATFTWFVIGI